MDDVRYVRLNVLLCRELELAGEVALGAGPGGLHLNRVVVGDKEEADLALEFLVPGLWLPGSALFGHFYHLAGTVRARGGPHLGELYLHHAVGMTHRDMSIVMSVVAHWSRVLNIIVSSDEMGPQTVPSLESFFALGALMGEVGDVGLNVLLDGVSGLCGEVTLGALPDRLPNHGVVRRDQELIYLTFKLF